MSKPLHAVICVLNSKYIHSSLSPWCLLAGVQAYSQEPVTVNVLEGTINEPIEAPAKRILEQAPDVIGFSCYIWNIHQTLTLVRMIKEQLPNVVILLGGPEVSYHTEEVLAQEPLVDYILSGEGEKPFALLLDTLCRGETPENLPGLSFRLDHKIIAAPPYIAEDDPPSPYTPEYLAGLKGRIAYLETSRGCPYSCAFCLSGRCGNARFFNLERAKKELLLLANSGTKTVKLVDRTFNANRPRAKELFRFIIERYGTEIPEGVCFHFEIAGDILDEETIEILASAPVGSIQLEIGLQSFHPETLKAIHRRTDVEKLKRNISALVQNRNMHIHIDLIAGLPYEDFSCFAESFNIAYALKPNMLQMGFLKLLHGAAMRENSKEFPCTYSSEPPYEVTETPWLSKEELALLHSTEDALERLLNSGRFSRTLVYLFEATHQKPFDLFYQFGVWAAKQGTTRISLDAYIRFVYTYFKELEGVSAPALRDVMVCDRLATNASGKLPEILKISDPALKHWILTLEESEDTRSQKGVKRGAALLYSQKQLVYADYKKKNPVTGEFPLHFVPWIESQEE